MSAATFASGPRSRDESGASSARTVISIQITKSPDSGFTVRMPSHGGRPHEVCSLLRLQARVAG
jgi:hypothetical protein